MSERLRRIRPAELDDEQREVYEAIAGGRRAQGPQHFRLVNDDGGLEGPFNAFLLQPQVGNALQSLGAAIRYATSLSDRAREIAILAVAGWWDCEFERYAHEALGRAIGLSEREQRALHDRRPDDIVDAAERLVAEVCFELCATGDLSDATFGRAETELGSVQVFELTSLVGYYATLALQLRVFRVVTPEAP